jgi:hypothetical protein
VPNWVNNVYTIVGPENRVKEFRDNARGTDCGDDTRDYEFSFNQLIPLPDGDCGLVAQRRDWGIKWGSTTDNVTIHNESRVTYRYDTAWCIGAKFHDALSAKYPELYLFLSAQEEDSQRIRAVWHKGELVWKTGWERFDYDECPEGTDEDDWYEQQHEHCIMWYQEYTGSGNHDEWVFLYSLENNLDWNSFGDLEK